MSLASSGAALAEFAINQELANNKSFNKMYSAVEALGLRPEPMRGVWNNASMKDRRFICRVLFLQEMRAEGEHDFIRGGRAGGAIWGHAWDELGANHKAVITEIMLKLSAWARKLGV